MRYPRAALGIALVLVVVGASYVLLRESPQDGSQRSHRPLALRGKIAFLRAGPGEVFLPGEVSQLVNPHIVVLDLDSMEERTLTKRPTLVRSPAWSPDGTTLAFAGAHVLADRPPQYGLYLIREDGSRLRRLTRCVTKSSCSDLSPAWSPDGRKIAFWRRADLYVVAAEGGEPRRLVHEVNLFGPPMWSSDGTHILFSGARGSRPPVDIYIVNADGTGLRRLTTCRPPACEGGNSHPRWSPDESMIAFVRGVGQGEIWIMNADGTEESPLTHCPPGCRTFDSGPVWSPDGRGIAFARGRRARVGLFVVSVDGSQIRRLTSGPSMDCCPTWTA